ncbi:MAG: DUF1415 domain-containing protein [Colwellia sp.]|nr:DUF1415 domain-containing protein [Colwellia sp.]
MHKNEVLQTQQWLEKIIVGLNFCPFAKKELVNNTIHYHLSSQVKLQKALEELIAQCSYLEQHDDIETSLVIYNQGFKSFESYLDLVALAEDLLIDSGFEGIFQLASFHPDYYFEGEDFDDPANFTNRSPYPTLHIIREQSMARVLAVYKNPEQIPDNNIAVARKKGSRFFSEILKDIKR